MIMIIIENFKDLSVSAPREGLEIRKIGCRQFAKTDKNVRCAGGAAEPRICHSFHTTLSILFPARRQMKY